jgi:enoyl-CoA hydratase/carnithine racemase
MIARAYTVIEAAAGAGVLRITLNNPARRNAIGPTMINELLYALADGMDDPDVRSVVLTGAGVAFCVGGDFGQFTSKSGEPALDPKGNFADLLLAIMNAKKPVVARVNGHALGGGLGLVAASHFAIGVRRAKLGTPEIDVGLFPMMIMAVLQRHVPRRRLLEMMLFGKQMDADEAARSGLLNKVVEDDGLDAAVEEVTSTIASKSPMTVRLGLEAFAAQDDLDLETALPMLSERLAGCLATDDAREGLTAFLEKRPPKWTGR